MRRGALFAEIVLGTCLLTLAYMDGARPAVPGVPRLIGVTLGAVLAWLALAAAVTWLAEMLRRHHKAIAAHGWRHGKRGTLAAARVAGRGSRSVTSRLTSWAGPRWAARLPVEGGVDRALPQDAADRRAVIDDEGRRANICQACGHPGTPGDPVVMAEGYRIHTSHTTDPSSGFHDPAAASAAAVPAQNGETTMANNASRINPDRRAHRAAASSGGTVPSEWGPVVAAAADFEPESDAHLLAWLSDQVQGIGAYAEALIEAYETGVNGVGIDPKGLATLHDVADAVAHAAETMNAAKGRFSDHYELPREFAAGGGLMTHDGRWVTGEGG